MIEDLLRNQINSRKENLNSELSKYKQIAISIPYLSPSRSTLRYSVINKEAFPVVSRNPAVRKQSVEGTCHAATGTCKLICHITDSYVTTGILAS